MKFKLNAFLYTLFFITTLFFTYYIGIAFYDITTGLDFNKYIKNIYFFNNESSIVFDSQGTLYFWSIAKLSGFSKEMYTNQNLNNLINNKLQLVNFIYYFVGTLGLYRLLKIKKYSYANIMFCLSILNFFPTGFYLRLTLKPEIMAFAFLPWLIVFIEHYLKNQTNLNTLLLSFFFSIIFTIKASITGMVLLALLLLYKRELLVFQNKIKIFSITTFISSLILYLNFRLTNVWLFSRPKTVDNSLINKWNNTADLNFFINFDFKNLYQNPFKHVHSDSFLSITLLDTISDYFTFFWKHEENGNFFPYDTIKFTDNFLIQNYLPDYISIVFTSTFYVLGVILFIRKVENREYFLLPFCGLTILIINSLGFPSKNFDPETGDLFKVHYYSFLICISLIFLLAFIYSKTNYIRFTMILLIPVFMITIGFPKTMTSENLNGVLTKIEHTIICKTVGNFLIVNCK